MMKKLYVLLFLLISASLFAQTAIEPFGSGTENDPYLIENLKNLYWISVETNGGNSFSGQYFLQIDDIDASETANWTWGESWNDPKGWIPIGNTDYSFKGNYNGNNYIINDLSIRLHWAGLVSGVAYGLFGHVKDSEIMNVHLTNLDYSVSEIRGYYFFGGLIGLASNANIINCNVGGNIEILAENTDDIRLGGLIGTSKNSSLVTHSMSSVDVLYVSFNMGLQPQNYDDIYCIGGLVGNNSNSMITNSTSKGEVVAESFVLVDDAGEGFFDIVVAGGIGGLVGRNNGTILNSSKQQKPGQSIQWVKATIDVDIISYDGPVEVDLWTGELGIGGLVGKNYGIISNTFSTVRVDANMSCSFYWLEDDEEHWGSCSSGNPDFGGLVGQNWGGTVINSYWDRNTSNNMWSQGGSGRTTEQMTSPHASNTYVGWDFENTWIEDEYHIFNDGYPYLTQSENLPPGDGSETSPYLISTINHLLWISEQTNGGNSFEGKYFRQVANIDASPTANWNDGEGWEPIGSYSWPSYNPFSGNYIGQGHIVDGLTINRPGHGYASDQGLFGIVDGGSISNLGVTNVNIIANSQTGALAGSIYNSSVFNCFSTGNMYMEYSAGGLIGTASNSNIYNSHSKVVIDAFCLETVAIGGLIGVMWNTTIADSYFNGQVFVMCEWWAGGIGGLIGGSYSGIILNNYNHGQVITQNEDIGGLLGYGRNTQIVQSYNTGKVQGENRVGGLVGYSGSNFEIIDSYSTGEVVGETQAGGLVGSGGSTSITNSYWNTETSGQQTSDGGEGRTTDEMTYPYADNTFVDWNFETVWSQDNEYVMNNGYPFLQMQGYITNITFNVMDVHGDPVENAMLFFNGISFGAGNYVVQGMPSGTYNYVISKIGYKTKVGILNASGSSVTVPVILEKDDAAQNVVGLSINQPDVEACFTEPAIFNVSGGGSYCDAIIPSGISVELDGSEEGVLYQLFKHSTQAGLQLWGTGSSIAWHDVTEGEYTVVATNGFHYVDMNGSAVVTAIEALPVSVTINASDNDIEEDTEVTFFAHPVNGGSNPFYQWMVNDIEVGSNAPEFTYIPENGDQVQVILYSSEECNTGPAESNVITMIVGVSDVPEIRNIPHTTIPDGFFACFDATQSIIVAANEDEFIVKPGGSAELIAGENILFMPGTHVHSGGHLHAYISNNYCDTADDKEVITTVAQPTQTQHQGKLFTVYPNPTRGSFTLELTELPQYPGITVEIYGITGNQVLSAELSGETVYSLSLEGRQPGIYIVRVLIGDQIGVERIIKR